MTLLLLLGCRSMVSAEGNPAGALERWDQALQHLVVDGHIDLDRLAKDPQPLHDYAVWASRPQVFGGRIKADRHAFWLNTIQALSLSVILERRPESMDARSLWVGTAFTVGGETLSLSEMVHERIRHKELDYRDHAALVFGNRGGPPAWRGIYRNQDLSAQLDEAMTRWIDAGAVRVEGEEVVFAERFTTYSLDFNPPQGPGDLCLLAARHAQSELAEELRSLANRGCPHRFESEDWSVALPAR